MMDTKPFGWTAVELPVIGQGTWHMGESRHTRAAEITALQLGLDLGLTHIDTAEMYGSGEAEALIAAAIRDRRRADLFLVSKVLPEHASYTGTIRAAEHSLRRLGTDYLDLYLLHWPSRYPIGETMRAMEALVGTGKIRLLGVSNFTVDEMRAAMAALTRERLACNQVCYNLARRGIERDLIPFCEREHIAVVGYSPFGDFPHTTSAQFRLLTEIGATYGKTPRQVALCFLTRAPHVFTIPKSSNPEHVRENAGAARFTLTPADLAAMDRTFPAPRRPVPLAMR